MQIIINIPKEFENHFNSDRFEDSMQRIKQDIKDMICGGDVCISGNYEVETLDMLIKSFKECTLLPKGHGNIYDENDIKKRIENPYQCQTVLYGLKLTKPIIEADKESEEE